MSKFENPTNPYALQKLFEAVHELCVIFGYYYRMIPDTVWGVFFQSTCPRHIILTLAFLSEYEVRTRTQGIVSGDKLLDYHMILVACVIYGADCLFEFFFRIKLKHLFLSVKFVLIILNLILQALRYTEGQNAALYHLGCILWRYRLPETQCRVFAERIEFFFIHQIFEKIIIGIKGAMTFARG